MICPSCGEENQGKHTFCVVCGADLTQRTVKDALKSQKEGIEKTAKRLKERLQQPIGGKKNAPDPSPEKNKAIDSGSPPVENEAIMPDFMRDYIK